MFLGVALLLIGAGWLLQILGFIPQDAAIFWPLVLIAFALYLLFGRCDRCCLPHDHNHKKEEEK